MSSLKRDSGFIRENVAKANKIINLRATKCFIGSYTYEAVDDVVITNKGIQLVAPNMEKPEKQKVLNIMFPEINKICTLFADRTVVSMYVTYECSMYIRKELSMSPRSESEFYFERNVIHCLIFKFISLNQLVTSVRTLIIWVKNVL